MSPLGLPVFHLGVRMQWIAVFVVSISQESISSKRFLMSVIPETASGFVQRNQRIATLHLMAQGMLASIKHLTRPAHSVLIPRAGFMYLVLLALIFSHTPCH